MFEKEGVVTVSVDTEKSSRLRNDICPQALITQRQLLTLGIVHSVVGGMPDYS